MKKVFLSSFFFLSFFYILPLNQVNASKIIFSEDFSDQILEDWSEKRNSQWSNPSSKCKFGLQDASWKIENGKAGIEINGHGCVTELTPDNFSLTNIKNFSYKLDISLPQTTNVDRNYVIKYIDGNNWIGVHIINQDVIFQKVVNGTGYFLNRYQSSYNFVANQEYEFENIILDDNRVKVLINGDEVLNFIDEAPFITDGTIGLQASVGAVTNSKVLFDNIIVTDLDTVDLEVPFFSQNNPLWGNDEYDSASDYPWGEDDPSIDAWGCYMSSAAMMLRFHEHTSLPDGTDLNPQSLNQWLNEIDLGKKGQGYIKGNTNYNAITHLTVLNNQIDSDLPKFEYMFKDKNDEFLKNELKAGRPVMLQVTSTFGQHFVVAKGINNEDKIVINDPEATQGGTLLEKYNDQYVSMRTYTPTQSDLSYFMFVPSSPDLQLTLKDENGNIIPLQIVMDDAVSHQTTSGMKQPDNPVLGIPKPETGTYTLEVSSSVVGPYSVGTFLYNNRAEANIFESTGFISEEPVSLTINFDKTDGGEMEEEQIGFEEFIYDLDLMWEIGHFKKFALYKVMRIEAQIANKAPKRNTQLALAKTIQKSIQLMKPATLSPEGKEYLLTRIQLVIDGL